MLLPNGLMTQVFEGTDIKEQVQRIFAHIKTQLENPWMPESGFRLDQIMHLHINFHKLTLTQGSSYTESAERIAKKKAMIKQKNNNNQCFKWVVIAAFNSFTTKVSII